MQLLILHLLPRRRWHRIHGLSPDTCSRHEAVPQLAVKCIGKQTEASFARRGCFVNEYYRGGGWVGGLLELQRLLVREWIDEMPEFARLSSTLC